MINPNDPAGHNGSTAHLRSENTVMTLYDVVARLENDANRHEQQCMDLRRRAADLRDMARSHHDETTAMCRHCQIPTIKDQLNAWTHIHGRSQCHETADTKAEPITQDTPPAGTPVPATALTTAAEALSS